MHASSNNQFDTLMLILIHDSLIFMIYETMALSNVEFSILSVIFVAE